MEEGNVLFNNSLNTFYLQLYGVGYMVQSHSDSEMKPLHGLLFLLSSKVFFICTILQTGQPLLHQLWSTGWKEIWLNGSTMRD